MDNIKGPLTGRERFQVAVKAIAGKGRVKEKKQKKRSRMNAGFRMENEAEKGGEGCKSMHQGRREGRIKGVCMCI